MKLQYSGNAQEGYLPSKMNTIKDNINKWKKNFKRTWILYLFILPALTYIIIFSYIPLYGIQIAFKKYLPTLGIWESQWVGLEHFKTFFSTYHFKQLLANTLTISIYQLLAGFPIPIILAMIINYTKNNKFKRTLQTVTYAPHFISVVVFCGMIFVFLGSDGIINQILSIIGIQTNDYMGKPEYFRHIYVWSGVLKNMGWASIIYIAALAGVNPELHEAAIVDGATKLHRIRYIDFPSILPTAVILLIMNAGRIMSVGFEKAFLLQNNINIEYSEIISTYVYKMGIQSAQFSYSTAIGLFNNLINFILLISVNKIAKYVTGTGLW